MTQPSVVGESDDHSPFLLGVDGGGTKTLAWVARIKDDGKVSVFGKGFAGSSNQVAVGVESALDNLAIAVEKACDHANTSPDQIPAGVFAVAGSGNEDARQRLVHFAEQRFKIPSVQVIHDGQAVLEAGTAEGWGVALIAGTGAVAFGKNQQSETSVVGGWGYWFGDEGSAYWLGQSALRAIAQTFDGRAAATELTSKVLERLEIEDPRQILAALSEQGDTRLAIADLADLVCEVAASNDAVATNIFDEASQHWLKHVESVATQLSLTESFPLALAGGIFCGSELARNRFSKLLAANGLSTSSVEIVTEPVLGCVLLASRTC